MESSNIDLAQNKVGGRFKLSVLLQRRVRELVRGSVPMTEVEGKPDWMQIALKEIIEDKLSIDRDDPSAAEVPGS